MNNSTKKYIKVFSFLLLLIVAGLAYFYLKPTPEQDPYLHEYNGTLKDGKSYKLVVRESANPKIFTSQELLYGSSKLEEVHGCIESLKFFIDEKEVALTSEAYKDLTNIKFPQGVYINELGPKIMINISGGEQGNTYVAKLSIKKGVFYQRQVNPIGEALVHERFTPQRTSVQKYSGSKIENIPVSTSDISTKISQKEKLPAISEMEEIGRYETPDEIQNLRINEEVSR